MNQVLTTQPKTYFHFGALVILVVTAMGAGSLLWWQAGVAAAALVALPWIVARIVKLLRRPEPGPGNGGNITFTPGRPGPGGKPGRIVFQHYASDTPFVCFENADTKLTLSLFMGDEAPDPESPALPGSVYLLLGSRPGVYVKQEICGGWRAL